MRSMLDPQLRRFVLTTHAECRSHMKLTSLSRPASGAALDPCELVAVGLRRWIVWAPATMAADACG